MDREHPGGQHLVFLAWTKRASHKPDLGHPSYEHADYPDSIHIRDDGWPYECHCYLLIPY